VETAKIRPRCMRFMLRPVDRLCGSYSFGNISPGLPPPDHPMRAEPWGEHCPKNLRAAHKVAREV
jgi:hypothetical protein